MKITIDDHVVSVTEGETVLDAATRLGINIPTLCYVKSEHEPASCLVCLVKYKGKFVPACATKIEDGMIIESETEEVRQLRRTALELLLSDHFGDCYAPCQLACPARLDIPLMLRQIRAENPAAAIQTIKETIPLPAVLGRVCPKPCEKICRRKEFDKAVEICTVKRYAADYDLAQQQPYFPPLRSSTGKRVIIIGAGPSGLSAAFYLARFGHRVALYAQGKKPGGRLRTIDESQLPASVLDAEIRTILSLPIDYYPDEHLDWMIPATFAEIQHSFDAVLLCTGQCSSEILEQSGFETVQGRLRIDLPSFQTSVSNVFATGTIFRAKTTMIVRSVADGREAAESIDRFLQHGTAHPAVSPYYGVKLGKLSHEELTAFAETNRNDKPVNHSAEPVSETATKTTTATATATATTIPAKNIYSETNLSQMVREAERCLHCDCRGRSQCRLLRYASLYQADNHRFEESVRKPFTIQRSGNIIFEAGKCIKCGICVNVSKKADEEWGLTFLGRGFEVRIGVPFGESFQKALTKSAAEAVQLCPTAALSFDD
ncbi:MAG: (2Fe-2S)-binding protein [Planctomycetaceae bacterium]|jgi:ferredoxin-like protein FixX/ferredoxin|nr:(2Fe-2S)-binding protein [Planctomycetaceae bacterium]